MHFGFKEGGKTNLLMGGRYLIMPQGQARGINYNENTTIMHIY